MVRIQSVLKLSLYTTLLVLPLAAAQAQPTPMTGESSRGVRILEAEPQPAPTPPPAPTPAPPPPAPKPTPPRPPMVIKFCDRPFASPDIALAGAAEGFDAKLSASLRTRKRVVINLDRPYPDKDAAPAPLARWLSEVKAGGGTVSTKQYCQAARGNLASWLAEIFAPKSPQAVLYRPARQYNVILHADALDKVVTQVEFAPKTPSAGG